MNTNVHPLVAYRVLHGLSQVELGALLGVKGSAVSKWEKRRPPAERVPDLHRVTGIPLHRLRPDIYPKPAAEGR